jgi:hypothetical protein
MAIAESSGCDLTGVTQCQGSEVLSLDLCTPFPPPPNKILSFQSSHGALGERQKLARSIFAPPSCGVLIAKSLQNIKSLQL